MTASPEALELTQRVNVLIASNQLRQSPYWFSVDSPTRRWKAPLFSMPCQAPDCDRHCSRALPYCRQHLTSEYRVRLGRTSLRNRQGRRHDFWGLFAAGQPGQRVFRAGEPIMPYLGEVTQSDQWLLNRYGKHTVPYGFAHSGQSYYTDSALLRGAGANINTATPERQNNVEFRNTLPLAMIYASEDIYDGDELLLHYGNQYQLDEPGVVFSTARESSPE